MRLDIVLSPYRYFEMQKMMLSIATFSPFCALLLVWILTSLALLFQQVIFRHSEYVPQALSIRSAGVSPLTLTL